MDASKYYSSDKVQFRAANKELKKKLENDDAFRKDMYKRHPELADWVDSGRMDSSPAGFTWHHSEETGKLLLVDASDHRSNYKIYHPEGVGGRYIWGGGHDGRVGHLDQSGNLKAKYR